MVIPFGVILFMVIPFMMIPFGVMGECLWIRDLRVPAGKGLLEGSYKRKQRKTGEARDYNGSKD